MHPLLLLLIILIFGTAAIAGLSAAPWVPTKPKQKKQLIEVVNLPRNAVCYDLGCGDGTVLFALARKHPDAKAIGYDISILPLLIGWTRKLLGGKKYKNVSIRFGNLFKKDVSDADLVFVFLLDKSYARLKEKFRRELKDDANIVVEAWPIKNIQPIREIRQEGLLPIYIYEGSSFR